MPFVLMLAAQSEIPSVLRSQLPLLPVSQSWSMIEARRFVYWFSLQYFCQLQVNNVAAHQQHEWETSQVLCICPDRLTCNAPHFFRDSMLDPFTPTPPHRPINHFAWRLTARRVDPSVPITTALQSASQLWPMMGAGGFAYLVSAYFCSSSADRSSMMWQHTGSLRSQVLCTCAETHLRRFTPP